MFSVFALLHVSDILAFRSAFYGSEGLALSSISSPIDPVMGATRYLIFLISAVLLILYWKTAFRTIVKNPLPWILVLVAMLSMLWSVDLWVTRSYALKLFGWSLFGTYLAARYTLHGQLKILSTAMLMIVLITIGFTAVFPGYGIDNGVHAGALRGAFWHKNSLGFFLSLSSCLFCINIACSVGRRRVFWLVLSSIAVICLLLSTSVSALAIFFVTLLALTFYRTFRWDGRLFIPIFCVTILILGFVLSWLQGNFEATVIALGRDPSLSGRTNIWLAVVDKIYEKPLLGYGMGAFWNTNGPAEDIWKTIGFAASKSHNGFIDMAAELGLVGVSLFSLSFLLTFVKATQWAKMSGDISSFWPLMYLTVFLIQNQTEGPILGGFTWIVYLSVSLSLSSAADKEQCLLQRPNDIRFSNQTASTSILD